jgi:hypothetical protein
MAHFDNLATKLEQEAQFEAIGNGIIDGDGVDAGMAFIGYPLPAMCFKPVYMYTPYERGFLFGMWLQQWLKSSPVAPKEATE